MLDKTSKRFLKCLSNQSDHTIFYYDDWPDEISDLDEDVIFACIRYLSEKKLCEICISANSGQHIGVRLSHEGLHYNEFRLIHVQEFLQKSIIVPVIVALLTALATSIFTYQWNKFNNTNNASKNTTIPQAEAISSLDP